MSTRVVVNHRLFALMAIVAVFIGQSLFAVAFSSAGPFSLWSSTLLLLLPAIAWLLAANPHASIAATVIMTAFIVAANLLGGLMPFGYIVAFWLGLPISALVAWRVSKRRAIPSSRQLTNVDD